MKAWFSPPPLARRLERLERELENELLDAEFNLIAYRQHVESLQAKLAFVKLKLEKTDGR